MKNSKRILLRVLPIVMVLMVIVTGSVFGIEVAEPTGGSSITRITDLTANIWSTIAVIVQVLAIAAIIFAGVRYMFAAADDKANIKTQTVTLFVGAILVFAAVPITQFIVNIAKDTIK